MDVQSCNYTYGSVVFNGRSIGSINPFLRSNEAEVTSTRLCCLGGISHGITTCCQTGSVTWIKSSLWSFVRGQSHALLFTIEWNIFICRKPPTLLYSLLECVVWCLPFANSMHFTMTSSFTPTSNKDWLSNIILI